jgi:hypothetical protein
MKTIVAPDEALRKRQDGLGMGGFGRLFAARTDDGVASTWGQAVRPLRCRVRSTFG